MALLVAVAAAVVAAATAHAAAAGYGPPYYPPPPTPTPPPAPVTHTLSVTKDGTGGGTVTSAPGGIACGTDCSEAYATGTSVTLAPSPDAGSSFGGWSGACTGTGPCTVALDASRSVTATFVLDAGGQPTAPQDTAVEASLTNVELVLRAGKRVVRARLTVGEPVSAELRLRRSGRALAGKIVSLSAGQRLATFRVPGGVAAGRATLRIVLEDEAGNTKTLTRSVRIPLR